MYAKIHVCNGTGEHVRTRYVASPYTFQAELEAAQSDHPEAMLAIEYTGGISLLTEPALKGGTLDRLLRAGIRERYAVPDMGSAFLAAWGPTNSRILAAHWMLARKPWQSR